MRTFARFVTAIIANGAALFIAQNLVPGFVLPATLKPLAVIALTLTLLNILIKPLLKLLLGPIILLTLGMALIAINAVLLFILDFLLKELTIQSVWALLLGSLLLGAVHLIFHIAQRET